VKKYTFNWEIQTLLEQFIGAFNDVVIKRYDNQKNLVPSLSAIKVSYVYGPKQRVFNTLQNPAPGGIVVPAIAVSIGSISRDASRVFNKHEGFTVPYNTTVTTSNLLKNIPQPIPINIGVNMTMITKYQNDMDQLLSNFAPYCDPYIVISWKLPSEKDNLVSTEIRTEILWSGDIRLTYPNDAGPNQSFRITADTSFTIKGWLFKKIEENYKKIYVINSDFNAVDLQKSLLLDLDKYETDYITVSGRPQISFTEPCKIIASNQFLNDGNLNIEVFGKSFFDVRNVYISASNEDMFGPLTFHNPFSSIPNMALKYPAFNGIVIPSFNLFNENYLSFSLPQNPNANGLLNIILENEAGYGILTTDNKTPMVSAYVGANPIECKECGLSGIQIKVV
jgi:hypothetical protein